MINDAEEKGLISPDKVKDHLMLLAILSSPTL